VRTVNASLARPVCTPVPDRGSEYEREWEARERRSAPLIRTIALLWARATTPAPVTVTSDLSRIVPGQTVCGPCCQTRVSNRRGDNPSRTSPAVRATTCLTPKPNAPEQPPSSMPPASRGDCVLQSIKQVKSFHNLACEILDNLGVPLPPRGVRVPKTDSNRFLERWIDPPRSSPDRLQALSERFSERPNRVVVPGTHKRVCT